MSGRADLTITYTGRRTVDDPYWLRLEQDQVTPDLATVADTAAYLDAVYRIDPCTASEEEPEPTAEDAATAAQRIFAPAICRGRDDGAAIATIRIIRSHPAVPYRIHVAGGEVAETRQINAEVDQVYPLDRADSLTLDYPVIESGQFGWQYATALEGASLPIDRTGNTLHWPGMVAGSLRAQYLSAWDEVDILVHGRGAGRRGEATVRVVYHGLVDEIVPELPPVLDDDRSLCPSYRWDLDDDPDRVTCYQIEAVSVQCGCSKREVNYYTRERIVTCPEYVQRCPNNDRECMHLLGTVGVTEYVACDDDNQAPGRPGQVYSVSKPSYYESACCQPPSVQLPDCVERIESYPGGHAIQGGEQSYRDLYGPQTRFVAVLPAGGTCGEHIIRQVVSADSCCAGATLSWTADADQVEVLTPGTYGEVWFSGDIGPYTVAVSGSGFFFAGGVKSLEIAGGPGNYQVRVNAAGGACGSATIEVVDGCGNRITRDVRSTLGRWALVSHGPSGLSPCALVGDCTAHYTGTGYVFELVSGRWKIIQEYAASFGVPAGHPSLEAAIAACQASYAAEVAALQDVCSGEHPSRCDKCFSGAHYEPCKYLGASFPGHYDPQSVSSCDQHVFGFVYGSAPWWQQKVHRVVVSYSWLHEWVC